MAIPTVTVTGALEVGGAAPLRAQIKARLSQPGYVLHDGEAVQIYGPAPGTVDAEGHLLISLVPNEMITPRGTYWIVTTCMLDRSKRPSTWTQRWRVPSGSSPITLADVEVVAVPSSVTLVAGPRGQDGRDGRDGARGDPGEIAPFAATGCTALRSAADRAADVANAKDRGAKGDGATDDTAKIQAAIDAVQSSGGGYVYLPAGTYRIASLLLRDRVKIKGAGEDRTKLVYAGDVGGSIFAAAPGVNVNFVAVESMTLDGDARRAGIALDLAGSAHGQFRNLLIRNVSNAAVLCDSSRGGAYFSRPCIYNHLEAIQHWNAAESDPDNYSDFGVRIIDGANSNYLYSVTTAGSRQGFTIEDEVNVAGALCNNNNLVSCSAEGTLVDGFFLNAECNNVFAPRIESHSGTAIRFGTGERARMNSVLFPTVYSVPTRYVGIDSARANVILDPHWDTDHSGWLSLPLPGLAIRPSTGHAYLSLIPNNGEGLGAIRMGATRTASQLEGDDESFRFRVVSPAGVWRTAFAFTTNTETPAAQFGVPLEIPGYATASRPAASSYPAGAMIYDLTLHLPLWGDGAAWRDAAGTAR